MLETHRNSLQSIKENYRLEIGKLKNNYHQERENAEMLRLKMGQLESDLERESNDSRAKTRQIKLLKSELKSVGASLNELQEHSEAENKRLNEQNQEIERQAIQLAHDYTKKLENLSVEMAQVKSIKTQLEIENSDLQGSFAKMSDLKVKKQVFGSKTQCSGQKPSFRVKNSVFGSKTQFSGQKPSF